VRPQWPRRLELQIFHQGQEVDRNILKHLKIYPLIEFVWGQQFDQWLDYRFVLLLTARQVFEVLNRHARPSSHLHLLWQYMEQQPFQQHLPLVKVELLHL
jgi:glycosyltransferase involved in cell wall biosynthesis